MSALPVKSKEMCVGCHNDYYNGKNERGIDECWLFKQARVVRRFKIGWWTEPRDRSCFTEVTILHCHNAPGQYALMEELPKHVLKASASIEEGW